MVDLKHGLDGGSTSSSESDNPGMSERPTSTFDDKNDRNNSANSVDLGLSGGGYESAES